MVFLFLIILSLVSITYAQTLLELEAATAIQDDLASQSLGPNAGYVQRAQNTISGIDQPYVPDPGDYAMQRGGTQGQIIQQGQQQPQVQIPKMTVIEGTRVYCRVCGKLLDEAVRKQIPATDENKSRYYDDGQNGGDLVANDGIYTNVETNRDYIGPECAEVRNKLIKFLNRAERESVVDFFRLRALSNDPISSLPKSYEKEAQKDEYLKIWRNKFLGKYKKNPDDPNSEFLPVYVPKPPEYPELNLQSQAQIAAQRRGPTGMPMPSAIYGEQIEGQPTPAPTPVPLDQWEGARGNYYDSGAMGGK